MEERKKVNLRLTKRIVGILMSLVMVLGMIGVMPATSAKADTPNSINFMTRSEASVSKNGNVVTISLKSQYEEGFTAGTESSFVPEDAGSITITFPTDKAFTLFASDGTEITGTTPFQLTKWVNENNANDWHYDLHINTEAESFTYSISAVDGYTLTSDSWYNIAVNTNENSDDDDHFGVITSGTSNTSRSITFGTDSGKNDVGVWTDVNRSLRNVDMFSDGLVSLVLNSNGTLTGVYNYVNEHGHDDENGVWVDPDVSNVKAGTVTVSVPDGYSIESCRDRVFYTDAPTATFTFTPESGYRVEGDYHYDKDKSGKTFGTDTDFRSNTSTDVNVDLAVLPYHFEQNSGCVHVSADFKEWEGMATIAISKNTASLSSDGKSLIINVPDTRSAEQKEDDERNNRGTITKVTLTVKERKGDDNNLGSAIAPTVGTDAYLYSFDINDLPDCNYFELVPDYNKGDGFNISSKLTNGSSEQYVDVRWEDDGDLRKDVCLDFWYIRDAKKLTNGNTYYLTFDNSNSCELRQDSETVRVWLHPEWIVDESSNSATYDYSYLIEERYNALTKNDLPKYTITVEGAKIVRNSWDDNGTTRYDDNYYFEFDRTVEAISKVKVKLSGDFSGHPIPLALEQCQWTKELTPSNGIITFSGLETELPGNVNFNSWSHDPFEDVYGLKEYHFYGLNLTADGMVQNGNTFTAKFLGYDVDKNGDGQTLETSVEAGTMTIKFPADAVVLGYERQRDEKKQDGTLENDPFTSWRDGLRFYTTADYVDVTYTPAAGFSVSSRWRWECDEFHNQHKEDRDGWEEEVWDYSGECYSETGTNWRVNGVSDEKFTCDDRKRTVIDTEYVYNLRKIDVSSWNDGVLIGMKQSGNSVIATFCHNGYDENGEWYKNEDIIAGTVTFTVPDGSHIKNVTHDRLFQELDENNTTVKNEWRESYFWTDADNVSIKVEPTKGHKITEWGHDLTVKDTDNEDEERFGEGKSYETRTTNASLKNIKFGDTRGVWTNFGEYLGTITINVDGRYATVDGNTITYNVNNSSTKMKINVTKAGDWDNAIQGFHWEAFYPDTVDKGSYKIYSWTFDAEDRWDKYFQIENASSFSNLTIWVGSYTTGLFNDEDVRNLIDLGFLEEYYRDARLTGFNEYTLSFSVPAPEVPTPAPEQPTPTPEQAENAAVTTPAPVQPVTEETTEVEKIGNSTTTTTVTENEDGSTTTVAETVNKDGSSTTTTSTTVVKEDGSTETVAETVNSDGTSSTTTTTVKENADGSVETVSETVNSDGTSSTTTATTVENEDGSKTTEALTENSDGTTVEETKTENADGSSSSVSVLKDEDGNTLATTSEDVSFNKYGTEVVETKVENADGSVVESVVKTTQAGKVVAQTAETDPEGNTTITLETEKTNGVDVVKTFVAEEDGIKLTEYQTEGKKATIPSTIEVGDTVYEVKTIGEGAFEGNESLEKITIPDTVETIGANAFNGAKSLKSVNLENVKTIGDNAFKGAKNLKKITLGSDLESISKGAFKGIPKNAKITILAPTEDKFNEIKNLIIESGVKKKNVNFVWKRTEE